jgi:hypothetical protein
LRSNIGGLEQRSVGSWQLAVGS